MIVDSPMQALCSPPPRWSFPVQQPELDPTPSSQTPSGGRPAAAKGLWEAVWEQSPGPLQN